MCNNCGVNNEENHSGKNKIFEKQKIPDRIEIERPLQLLKYTVFTWQARRIGFLSGRKEPMT